MRNFDGLSERELLGARHRQRGRDGRIFADFADGLNDGYPSSAKVFDEMAAEENGHRRGLIDLFVAKFGEHIPLIRRQDIRGYILRRPSGICGRLASTRRARMRGDGGGAARFYRLALPRATDASSRKLLGDLADEEEQHTDGRRARG